MNAKLALAALTAAIALTATGLSSANAQRVVFDPATNVAIVGVTAGETKEHTVRVPIGDGFLDFGEGVEVATLKGVAGPGGLNATLKSAKIVTVGGVRNLELKLDIKHEFFKGTGAGGAYPIQLMLENKNSRAQCNFFVTVMVK